MPLKTFYNLPIERQEEITNICLTEFAINDYESTSLSDIIRKLGVAKGSFYRYFESKQDLYTYLFKFAKEKFQDQNMEVLKDPSRDFFDAWLEFCMKAISIEKRHPLCLRFLSRISSERRPELFGEQPATKQEFKIAFFKDIIEFHQEAGNIRQDLDSELLASFLITVRDSMRNYFTFKYKMDFNPESKSEGPIFNISDELLREELIRFNTLLRDAMAVKA